MSGVAGAEVDYLVTLTETVFDLVAPCFGLTETVTLHVPALMPLRDVPTTLHIFTELPTTRKLTFDEDATVSFAWLAIFLPDNVRAIFTVGASLTVAVVPEILVEVTVLIDVNE